ncbi:MAG: hypothetical protein K5851_05105 [Lachnospiraceae bacterium]|nr:hypothetical protein [Lachnospiraceae bacterium]
MDRIIDKLSNKFPILKKLFDDSDLRLRASLYSGGLINLLYVILKVSTGIIFSSLWLSMMGGYYLTLAIIKGFILLYERSDVSDIKLEYKRYRSCGFVLIFLDMVLIIVIYLAVNFKAKIEFPGYLIYGMALYTFYAFILAIVNLVKARKHERPMYKAARIANFTAALVSMFSLEIAMMARFDAHDLNARKEMTILTGSIVFLIVTFMAITMIVQGTRCYKKE